MKCRTLKIYLLLLPLEQKYAFLLVCKILFLICFGLAISLENILIFLFSVSIQCCFVPCVFLLYAVFCPHSCQTLYNSMECSPQAPLSMNFLGKNTRVGSYFFLQGISLTQAGIKLTSESPALAGRVFTIEPLGKPVSDYTAHK